MLDECVTTQERLAYWVKACRKAGTFGFDTETTGLDIVSGKHTIVGFCLAISKTQGAYIPVGHKTGEQQLDFDYVLDTLAPILADESLTKVAHNFAFDYNACAALGLEVNNYEDTQLMSYALDGQKNRARGHSFDALTKFHLGYDSIRFQDVVIEELGIPNFSYVRLSHATTYASEDARMTLALYHKLRELLKAEETCVGSTLMDLYDQVDRPLPRIVADMKRRGIGLDLQRVGELHAQWCARMDVLQDDIDDSVGRALNLNSPKQLGEYLYDEMKCKVLETTDSGNPSTDDDTLELLANAYPAIRALPLIREFRELAKLTGSFTSSWLDKVGKDERVHGDFALTTTNTRRLASSNPNLQNIPANSKNGELLRHVFVAKRVPWAPKRKRVLVGGDLSQAEYRMLAHQTNCKPMLASFAAGHDFHAATAADIFGGKWTDYTNKDDKERYGHRTKMKNVNFANIYGASAPKIAAMCGIPEKEAYRILGEYAEKYPEVDIWKTEVKQFAHLRGYAETLFGGRVHVPHIKYASNKGMVKYAERQAVNGVIQGGCADYVRIAMSETVKDCLGFDDAWLLLQVHDELVFECYEDDADDIVKAVEHTITTCTNELIDWRVKFKSDVKAGPTWAAIKG